MFVFSFKTSKPKIVLILCILLVILVVIVSLMNSDKKSVINDKGICYRAANSEERLTFLSQFGWQVNEEPIEVTEVIIPSEFNDLYQSYNEIQKNQDLDLEKYKGARAKKWVYEIKNYPGYTDSNGIIRATLLICDNIVIGGDVSSAEKDGFVQGFEFPDNDIIASTSLTLAAVVQ